ncbi:MAG: thermonuclease family protein [Rhizobium sp.]|nr:thermonuclease family protein [Rhizobium sp.]
MPAFSNAALRAETGHAVSAPVNEGVSVAFTLCGSGTRLNCVVDGDTFWMNGEKIRIADIDTPELSPARCASEKAKGEAAKRALLSELNAGRFELAALEPNDTDVHGRKLRTVMRNSQSIGDRLIAKGLARPWTGSRRSWCD